MATGTGLKKETSAALSYLLGPVTGVIFLILEKDPYVRFHAMQSILVFTILWFVLPFAMVVTIILAFFVPLVALLSFVLWLVSMYKAFNGEEWEVPFLGKFVRQLLGKL